MVNFDVNDFSPEQKHYARAQVHTALRNHVLTKPTACEKCTQQTEPRKLDAHHHNGYDEEHMLDIQWLCRSCHGKTHYYPEVKAETMRRVVAQRLTSTTSEERSQGARDREAQLPQEVKAARSTKTWETRRARYPQGVKTRKPRTPCLVCDDLAKPGAKTCGQDACVRTMKSRAGQAGNKTRWGSRTQ